MFLTALDFIVDGVLSGRKKQRQIKNPVENVQTTREDSCRVCDTLPAKNLKPLKDRRVMVGLKNTISLFEFENSRLKLITILIYFFSPKAFHHISRDILCSHGNGNSMCWIWWHGW